MGKNEEQATTHKRSCIQELKGEFKKIVWPDKQSLAKESVSVIVIAIILGCVIAVIDWLLQSGMSLLTNLLG